MADVQAQARPTLALAVGFTVAALVAAVLPGPAGRWLPLHLFLVGGLLEAVSGVTQLLAVTWSAAPAPPRRRASTQRWLLAAGTVALAAGRSADAPGVAAAGGLAVTASLVLLAGLLVGIRRGAVVDRYRATIDGDLLAVVGGVAGTLAGVALVAAGASPAGLRAAHLTVNLFGLVGLVVVATLPSFAATQARTRTAERWTPGRQRVLLWTMAVASWVAAAGQAAGRGAVVAVGLGAYAAGLLALPALLPRPGRRQWSFGGARLAQLGAGWAWWVLCTVLLALAAARGRPVPGHVVAALVVGGFAQVLAASLAYLVPVLRGGGHRRLGRGLTLLRSWPGFAAGNVAAVALLAGAGVAAGVALAVWVLDAAARIVVLVGAGDA